MSVNRVKSAIFIAAHRRACEANGAFVTIARQGDGDAGLVMIRAINREGQERLLIETNHFIKGRLWRDLSDGFKAAEEIRQLVDRQIGFDSDLWLVDIEDPEGRTFLSEPIIAKDAI